MKPREIAILMVAEPKGSAFFVCQKLFADFEPHFFERQMS